MDAIISQWDCAALRYMREQECSEYVRCNKALVQARFPGFSGERVLDLGCGYGYYTDYFRTAGADAIGIDGSEKMIELARTEYPNTRFLVMDITKPLAFADGEFDVVFCNQVLMDIAHIAPVFSECRRILKPGGILYYGIVHPAFYDGTWIHDASGYAYAKGMDRYLTPYQECSWFWGETTHFHRPLSEYLNMAAQCGLVLTQTLEPRTYDPDTKNRDLPLFFFAEYRKPLGNAL